MRRRKLFTLAAGASAVVCAGAVGSLALSVASVAAWVRSRDRTDLLIHVRSPTSASEWSLASNGLTYCRLEQANSEVDPGWYKDLRTPGWYVGHQPRSIGPRWTPDAQTEHGWQLLGIRWTRGTQFWYLDAGMEGCSFLMPYEDTITAASVPYWPVSLVTAIAPAVWTRGLLRRRRR